MTIKVLGCGKAYVKAVNHTGIDLKGMWQVYKKIDGIRAIRKATGEVVSRNDKPLFNLDSLVFDDAEIFLGNWNKSQSATQTRAPARITQEDVYELTDGKVDARLYLGEKQDPKGSWHKAMMEKYVALGFEGIVIRKGTIWIKVVPMATIDLNIIGMKKGAGKNAGICGSIQTIFGSAGSFETQVINGKELTDIELRTWLWENREKLIRDRQVMQFGFRELTKGFNLRFARLMHIRSDKDEVDTLPLDMVKEVEEKHGVVYNG